jgi:hypothetical protein
LLESCPPLIWSVIRAQGRKHWESSSRIKEQYYWLSEGLGDCPPLFGRLLDTKMLIDSAMERAMIKSQAPEIREVALSGALLAISSARRIENSAFN